MAGTGALRCGSSMVQVSYDLIESSAPGRNTAEGLVFGDADALRTAYLSGSCDLQLEDGQVTKVVLLDCRYQGAADVAVKGQMRWA